MSPSPCVFDLSLPGLPLEAGARVISHMSRGWWWGPEQDLPWLRSRAHLLPQETVRENGLRVVPLDALGLERISLVTGGSLGGMIVLCLAVLAPERFERICPIAAAEEASPWVVGWNHVARQALLLDPEFPEAPARGLELARQLAMLTYRAETGLQSHHGRNQPRPGEAEAPGWSSRALYPIQSYLEYQGVKLRTRFDARTYLALLGAMDHHDLARAPEGNTSGTWGVARIRASALCVGIDNDQLFYPEHMERLTDRLRALGRHAEYAGLSSAHGHDGFLIEWEPLERLLRRALALPGASTTGDSPSTPGTAEEVHPASLPSTAYALSTRPAPC